jgi:hypothetical protein
MIHEILTEKYMVLDPELCIRHSLREAHEKQRKELLATNSLQTEKLIYQGLGICDLQLLKNPRTVPVVNPYQPIWASQNRYDR